MTASTALALAAIIQKYGIPSILQVINALKDEDTEGVDAEELAQKILDIPDVDVRGEFNAAAGD